ncbi:MAG: thiolase family protein [Acidimicrobiia bacterium]|nr:thiolase family protein [Acidimicrobiia bacterium]
MRSTVIVDAVRTPIGLRNGGLSGWHPADLVGELLRSLDGRDALAGGPPGDVVLGCVMAAGAQTANIARSAVLAAGWPAGTPALTVDRQEASGLAAFEVAVATVATGRCEVALAGGVELMSLVPAAATVGTGEFGHPYGPRAIARYEASGGLIPIAVAADREAVALGLDRRELDEWACASHERAGAAHRDGRFAAELVHMADRRRSGGVGAGDVEADEGPRAPDRAAFAAFPPTFEAAGLVTAANSAPVGDGAAAVVVSAEDGARAAGQRALARVVGFGVGAGDPGDAFGPSGRAVADVLARCGRTLDDIDRFEFHEARAADVVAWLRSSGARGDRVNPCGGAIALGDPLGMSGARLVTTLAHALARGECRQGLVCVPASGGQAMAVVLERCD